MIIKLKNGIIPTQSGAFVNTDTPSLCATHLFPRHLYTWFWKRPNDPEGGGLKKYPGLHFSWRNQPIFVAVPFLGGLMVIQVEPNIKSFEKRKVGVGASP